MSSVTRTLAELGPSTGGPAGRPADLCALQERAWERILAGRHRALTEVLWVVERTSEQAGDEAGARLAQIRDLFGPSTWSRRARSWPIGLPERASHVGRRPLVGVDPVAADGVFDLFDLAFTALAQPVERGDHDVAPLGSKCRQTASWCRCDRNRRCRA